MEDVITMHKFFFNTLRDLDKLAGLKQFQKLHELENTDEEIKNLLDTLIAVTNRFPQIPDKDKQEIILDRVITDLEFIGLNAKIIWKWLYAEVGKYNRSVKEQSGAIPSDVDNTPLTGEARQKKLQEWLSLLGTFEDNVDVKDRIALKRDMFFGSNQRNEYTPLSPTEIKRREDHINQLREQWKRDNNVNP